MLLRPVSFDFDDTLVRGDRTPILQTEEIVRRWFAAGHPCVITTARPPPDPGAVCTVILHCFRRHLPITQVYFTSLQLKGPTLHEIGAIVHYDDMEEQLRSAAEFGVRGVRVTKDWR